MKISIITVTLNNAEGLIRTLRSVDEQTYPDIEHIIVDGLSTDNTSEVLKAYPNVRVVSRTPRGIYDAINQGITQATGDVIGLLHGGDYFSANDVVSRIARVMNDKRIDFIYGDIHMVTPRSGRTVRHYSSENFVASQLLQGFAPPHPSLYLRRVIAQDPKWRYSTDYVIAADFEMFIRLFSDSRLLSKYVPIDMVSMLNNGISSHWRNRLYVSNVEKLKALRANGMRASTLSIMMRYFYILRSYMSNGKSK